MEQAYDDALANRSDRVFCKGSSVLRPYRHRAPAGVSMSVNTTSRMAEWLSSSAGSRTIQLAVFRSLYYGIRYSSSTYALGVTASAYFHLLTSCSRLTCTVSSHVDTRPFLALDEGIGQSAGGDRRASLWDVRSLLIKPLIVETCYLQQQ